MSEQQIISTRRKLGGWFIESTFICASILLAFWLDDWGEQRTLDARTNVALCNIREELHFNYDLLSNDYTPRHNKLIEYIDATIVQLEEQSQTADNIAMIDRPVFVEQVRNTAWELAIETGYLLHVDFKFAAQMAAVYNLQEQSYKLMAPKVLDVLFSDGGGINQATLVKQKRLSTLMNEWVQQLRYLMSNYDTLLQNAQLTKLDCD